jgi:hypothetical protein
MLLARRTKSSLLLLLLLLLRACDVALGRTAHSHTWANNLNSKLLC